MRRRRIAAPREAATVKLDRHTFGSTEARRALS